MLKIPNWIKRKLHIADTVFSSVLFYLCVTVFILGFASLMTISHLIISGYSPGWSEMVIAFIWDHTSTVNWAKSSPQTKTNILSSIVASLNNFVALALLIFPVMFIVYDMRRRRHLMPFRNRHVDLKLKEDVKLMRRYYQDAAEVTILSGDFDWLTNNDIGTLLLDMMERSKLTLVTDRTIAEVKDAVGRETFERIKSRLVEGRRRKGGPGIKCSLIDYGSDMMFMWRYNTSDDRSDGGRNWHIGVISEKQETRYLLRLLQDLCRPELSSDQQ